MTSDNSSTEKSSAVKSKVAMAAGSVGLATMLSRITGFVRDMVIAHFFGAKDVADAFFIAFRIPNILRRFTGEGALTAGMVPVFTSQYNKDKDKAFYLARNLITIMAISLALLVALCVMLAPYIVTGLAPGFGRDLAKFALTVDLVRLMLPYMLLISLCAALTGMSNSMGKFFIPAFAPVLLNLSIISCAYLLRGFFDRPVLSLAIGVLIGGVLQLILQYYQVWRLGFTYRPKLDLREEGTRKIGALMIPAAVGVAAVEINILVDSILASFLPEGSISYIYYGNRLVQLPLGIFGFAFGMASLPAMSREVSDDGSRGRLVEIFSYALRITFLVSIPSAAGMLLLTEPIMNLLFERGEFDELARLGSAYALAMLVLGLPAMCGVRVAVNVFYALKDTKTPARVAIWAVITNVFFSLILIGPMSYGGLALATAIASIVNFVGLIFLLRRRIGLLDGRRIGKSLAKMALSTGVMLLVVWLYSSALYDYEAHTAARAAHMSAMIFLGMSVYFLSMKALGSEEVADLGSLLNRRKSP